LRSRSHARSRKAMRLRLETWCSTWKSLTIRRKDCPNPSQYTVDVECNTNDKLAGNGAASKAGAAPQRWQLMTSECHSNGGGGRTDQSESAACPPYPFSHTIDIRGLKLSPQHCNGPYRQGQ
jgi:hypothetical protein